jgi:hypothetical protein
LLPLLRRKVQVEIRIVRSKAKDLDVINGDDMGHTLHMVGVLDLLVHQAEVTVTVLAGGRARRWHDERQLKLTRWHNKMSIEREESLETRQTLYTLPPLDRRKSKTA